MSKKCKNCGNINPYPLQKFCSPECKDALGINYFKKPQKPLKKYSSKNRNTVASFSEKVKSEILIRDKNCILCRIRAIQDYHHVYYGGQAEYSKDRNDVNKGVGLCRKCHEGIHHFTDGTSQELRRNCIEYLDYFYKK